MGLLHRRWRDLRRPCHHPRMQPIYLVVGSPSAGKSTTSRALAATFGRSIHVPVDDLRHMVVSGLALPGPDWSEELVHQVALARDTAIRMAIAYADAGFCVVLDDFYDPGGLAGYEALLRRPVTHGIVLYPTPEEARRRNATRNGGKGDAYTDEAITHSYSMLSPAIARLTAEGWLVLDTTGLDVEASVMAILEHAGRRPG